MREHNSHLIVGLISKENSELSAISRAMLLSRIISVLLTSTNSIGVYWGAATLVHSKDFFIERMYGLSEGDIPIELWIDLRLGLDDGNLYMLYTTGLKALGHKEIEIIKCKKKPEEIMNFAYNIIDYLLKGGPIVNHGDTIGADEKERIKVIYGKSTWDRSEDVMIIKY